MRALVADYQRYQLKDFSFHSTKKMGRDNERPI